MDLLETVAQHELFCGTLTRQSSRFSTLAASAGAQLAPGVLTGPLVLVALIENRLSNDPVGQALVREFTVARSVQNQTIVLRAPLGVAHWMESRGSFELVGFTGSQPAVQIVPLAHLNTEVIYTAAHLWQPYTEHDFNTDVYSSFRSALQAALALQ